jgi:hypothetical protein
MKPLWILVAGVVLMVVTGSPVHAQESTAPPDSHHPATPPGAPSAPPLPPGPPMRGQGMPMMDMCRQMMGDMMGMPMMPGMASQDPTERAEILEMRGEMMKAMGDIMMKHARRLQGMTSTAPKAR